MKVCILAPEFLPILGGVGTYIVELARHLPRSVEAHVVTPMRTGYSDKRLSTLDYDFSKYFGSNVQVHFVGKANDPFIYNAAFQYACLKSVPKLVREEGIDLVHSHTAHMPDLLLQFRKLDIPVVTTIHTTIQGQRLGTKSSGMPFWNLGFSERLTYLTYPFLRLAEHIYFSRKRHYITVSNWMKKQIAEQYPKVDPRSISVIHNSVDTELFSPADRKRDGGKEVVLFTGRLIAAKGIRFLVESIPQVLHEHPNTLFVFTGEGDSSPYERRLRELGVHEENWAFLGYLKEASDLVEYYRNASIYVAPTLYENLPIRILEAMACGIPAIASEVCAIPEVIDDGTNGVLVQPGSSSELTRALCCLLDDFNMRRKLGCNARKTMLEKFDTKVNCTRTVEVYERILNIA